MPGGLFQFEQDYAGLQDKYAQDTATNQYANFVAKQRFKRDREGLDKGFQRGFPQFTGGFAKKLGSGVKSGVFGQKLNEQVGDFTQQVGALDTEEGGSDSRFAQNQAAQQGAYQRALLRLDEERKAQMAMADPFATYRAVY